MRCYFFMDYDNMGMACVSSTLKIAKRKYQSFVAGELGLEYIELRCKWMKDADISGLSEGIIDLSLDALKRGIYGFAEYFECPRCKCENTVWYDSEEEGFRCYNCAELNDDELKKEAER